MPFVNVDLDRASPVLLLRTYFNVKRLYPDATVSVLVSPSGVGFHVRTDKEVNVWEYIKSQALLWADPVRTQYLLKKFALNPQEKHLDLMFNEKNDGKEKRIDMEAILNPYTREVQKIEELVQKGETEKAEELVQKVAKAIEPELDKHKHKQYVGCIAFKTDELHDQLEEICKKIMEKDKTFSWKLYPCWFPEFDWILAIFGTDKDTLWKKLVWFKNRAYVKKDDKIIRILKDVDTRLFIKERKAT